MSRDAAIPCTAPPPPRAVWGLVLALVAALFAEVLPTLARRPDLRGPVLRATLGLTAAGWRYLRARGADGGALRAAALRLCAALRAVVAAEESARMVPPAPADAPQETRGPAALRVPAPPPRARDGPVPARA